MLSVKNRPVPERMCSNLKAVYLLSYFLNIQKKIRKPVRQRKWKYAPVSRIPNEH